MLFTNAFAVLAAYALFAVANAAPAPGELEGEFIVVDLVTRIIGDPLPISIAALARLEAMKDKVHNAVPAKGAKVARQEPATIAYALAAFTLPYIR